MIYGFHKMVPASNIAVFSWRAIRAGELGGVMFGELDFKYFTIDATRSTLMLDVATGLVPADFMRNGNWPMKRDISPGEELTLAVINVDAVVAHLVSGGVVTDAALQEIQYMPLSDGGTKR